MKLATPTAAAATQASRTAHETAAQLESFVVKQLLTSSGAFKGDSNVVGSTSANELFVDTLAQAITKAGGLGLAATIERSLEAALASSEPPNAAPAGGGLGNLNVTSGFGQRLDPFTGRRSTHTGVDLGAPEGTPIPAAMDGVVISAGPRGGYGNAVEVRHADGSSTLYAHASEVLVHPGDQVQEGQPLALVGQTGRSTGPHLHLEVRRGGHHLDPRSALKAYRLRAEETGGGEP
jgi:murein DD-endopeptidase MepM/ murein hydrolase activator NlpD